MSRSVVFSSVILAIASASAVASAQGYDDQTTEIQPDTTLVDETISNAVIKVLPFGDKPPATITEFDGDKGGILHLRANVIEIDEGAILSVSGKGYTSVAGMKGGGDGGGGFPPAVPGAGGGAGCVGLGGAGSLVPACDFTGGAAGAITVPDPDALTMATLLRGSAGGAATGVNVTQGGAGGGILILEASAVFINGTVEARGMPSVAAAQPGGGGAGGMIYIKAYTLELGSQAKILVNGGDGLDGGTRSGGGGAGGVVLFEVRNPPAANHPAIDVAGGLSAGCGDDLGAGSPGAVTFRAEPTTCFDLDGDEQRACDTEGVVVDCNDTRTDIGNGAPETCNGEDDNNLFDNNCNTVPDWEEEDQEAICGKGGACSPPVTDDAGTVLEVATCKPADEVGKPKPPETMTVFFGGCSMGGAGKPFAALTMAAFAAALLARWRRRSGIR